MTGRMFNEFLGKAHFLLLFIGLNVSFMPMHELGLLGMNRRIALYDIQFQPLNEIATIGAYILGLSTLPFVINIFLSLASGEKVSRNPWRAYTLEWQTSSPPAIENFDGKPVLWAGPYDYGLNSEEFDFEKVFGDTPTETSSNSK